MLIRRAAFATLLGGCALIPDSAADPARGAGTAAALLAAEAARETAHEVSRMPAPSCRSYDLPTAGPARVVTDLVYVLKAPGDPSRRWWETREWVRDLDGDVSWIIDLTHRMPDGRTARRTLEDRVVDGAVFSAVDGRFAAAGRVRDLPHRVAAAPFESVDALLNYIAIEPSDRAVPAEPTRGLCRAEQELPVAHSVGLTLSERGREGWVRWEDEYTHMVVVFEESVRSVDRDIVAPNELWEVDPDESYRQVTRFVEAGIEEGWLQPPAFDYQDQGP